MNTQWHTATGHARYQLSDTVCYVVSACCRYTVLTTRSALPPSTTTNEEPAAGLGVEAVLKPAAWLVAEAGMMLSKRCSSCSLKAVSCCGCTGGLVVLGCCSLNTWQAAAKSWWQRGYHGSTRLAVEPECHQLHLLYRQRAVIQDTRPRKNSMSWKL